MSLSIPMIYKKLHQYKIDGLYRERIIIEARKKAKLYTNGQWYLSFINNDYLGLSQHPKVISAFKKACNQYGVGSSASALVSGYYIIHAQLEEALAEFTGHEQTLVFSNGYMANLAILTALISRKDIIFSDRQNHASLMDAGILSRAQVRRYQHNDLNDLAVRIQNSNKTNRWIVSDGVFSISGAISNLNELIKINQQYSANLIIDDSHAIGILGKHGRGSIEHHNVVNSLPIITSSFAKAFGTAGAFIASNKIYIEALKQFSRTYCYTSGLSPAIAAATLESLIILRNETDKREYLNEIIKYYTNQAIKLNIKSNISFTPIQNITIGNNDKLMQIYNQLRTHGILVGCIRPPTVPINQACLRINLNIYHTNDDIDYLLEKLSYLL